MVDILNSNRGGGYRRISCGGKYVKEVRKRGEGVMNDKGGSERGKMEYVGK
jgi:hypothetical protein